MLATDAPRWTILEVNEAYLAISPRGREELIGCALREAFPQPEAIGGERGEHPVDRMLAEALATGQHVVVPAQRRARPARAAQDDSANGPRGSVLEQVILDCDLKHLLAR